MALVEFQNNTAPYINADNLNNNFEYLEDKIEDIYSTDEVKTNKVWINGKPIYRKVITFSNTITTNETFAIAHSISNAELIKIKEFVIQGTTSTSNGMSYQFPIVGYGGALTDKSYAWVDRTNIYVYGNTGWGSGWTKYAILEYTKTTD